MSGNYVLMLIVYEKLIFNLFKSVFNLEEVANQKMLILIKMITALRMITKLFRITAFFVKILFHCLIRLIKKI